MKISSAPEEAQSEARARVLSGARRLFAEHGFQATSIRQIANELNIVSASLYHHFLTKDEILHGILRGPLQRLAEGAAGIANRPTSAEDRLAALVRLRIDAWLENWEAHAIVSNEAQFFRDRADFRYVDEAKAQGYRAMASVLKAGIDAGHFRSDLNVYLTITMMSGMLTSAAKSVRAGEVHTIEPPEPPRIEAMVGFLVDAIMRVIRVPDRIHLPVPLVPLHRMVV